MIIIIYIFCLIDLLAVKGWINSLHHKRHVSKPLLPCIDNHRIIDRDHGTCCQISCRRKQGVIIFSSKNNYDTKYNNITEHRGDESRVESTIIDNDDDRNSLNSDHNINKYILYTCIIMFFISAPLGMLLDNYHGLFHVLDYKQYNININLIINTNIHSSPTTTTITLLKSAIWVPILFGVAGFFMSLIRLKLDEYFLSISSQHQQESQQQHQPEQLMLFNNQFHDLTWYKIFYGISFFSFQYYLSGYLDYLLIDTKIIHTLLAFIAIIGYLIFDNTVAGLILSLLTAILVSLTYIISCIVSYIISYIIIHHTIHHIMHYIIQNYTISQ